MNPDLQHTVTHCNTLHIRTHHVQHINTYTHTRTHTHTQTARTPTPTRTRTHTHIHTRADLPHELAILARSRLCEALFLQREQLALCCSVLQCVAVCCSVLQCGMSACLSAGACLQRRSCSTSCLLCVAVCCSVVAVRCSVLQCVAVCCSVLQCGTVYCNVLQCVAACCSVLQCAAVCCSECCRLLQCGVAVSLKEILRVGVSLCPPVCAGVCRVSGVVCIAGC